MKNSAGAFRQLVDELAHTQIHSEFPETITVDDVRKDVDAVIIADWLGMEAAGSTFVSVLEDVCYHLTDDEAKSVLCGLAIGNPKVVETLQKALVERIALDVAYEAQTQVDNFEPRDDFDLPRWSSVADGSPMVPR